VRGQDNVVLVVSIPASELELTRPEDEADETNDSKKLLDRVGQGRDDVGVKPRTF